MKLCEWFFCSSQVITLNVFRDTWIQCILSYIFIWKFQSEARKKMSLLNKEISPGKGKFESTVKFETTKNRLSGLHCVKSVQIRSFSGLYFPVFGLNMEIYRVNLRIQSEYWPEKYGPEKTLYLDTFHAVMFSGILEIVCKTVLNLVLFLP